MNWIQQVLLSALIVLAVVIVMQNQRMANHLSALHLSQAASAELQKENLTPLLDNSNETKAFIEKMSGAEVKKALSQVKEAKQLIALIRAMSAINHADALRLQNKGKDAAAKIKAIKKSIWKAGDHYTQHKKKLQGMMSPIDKLVAAWNQGDISKSPDKIRADLQGIIGGIKQ